MEKAFSHSEVRPGSRRPLEAASGKAGLGFLAAWALLTSAYVAAAADTPAFLGGAYRADRSFPEFMPLWREGWKLTDATGNRVRVAYEGMPLGGYLHAFVQNTSPAEAEFDDVLLNGVSLREAIAAEGPGGGPEGKYASGLMFSKLPADQLKAATALGEPVWWKIDPGTVAANGMAEVIVRLRRPPQVKEVDVHVKSKGLEIQGTVSTERAQPEIVSIGTSPTLDTMYVYVRHPKGGIAPAKILLDGKSMADGATFVSDTAADTIPVVVRLKEPLREGDFHILQTAYEDGAAATTGFRMRPSEFVYGMWGYPQKKDGPEKDIPAYLEDLRRHNINVIMFHYGSDVRKYVTSDAGQAMCAKLGIAIMDHAPGGYKNQRYTFLKDEPDAHDFALKNIELGKRLGSLGQWLVEMGRGFRKKDPHTLQVVNVDNTFKPEQWYMYGQLADIACADPYYQEQLHSVYTVDPGSLGAYMKPTYVYAAGSIYQSAAAPRPMHLILHTCRFDMPENPFRPPTPEEKRVELYYGLAAGAREFSFWWYTPGGRYHGVGSDAPEMRRLFAEIGLVGAEFRSAEAVLNRACPAKVEVDGPRSLWLRSLLAGTDSMVMVVVNNNIASDRSGTVVQPVEKAALHVKTPAWLKAADVFEVTGAGTKDVTWKPGEAGVSADLGRVELTRMLIVTSDTELRKQIQSRYEALFAANAKQLIAEKAEYAKEAKDVKK